MIGIASSAVEFPKRDLRLIQEILAKASGRPRVVAAVSSLFRMINTMCVGRKFASRTYDASVRRVQCARAFLLAHASHQNHFTFIPHANELTLQGRGQFGPI